MTALIGVTTYSAGEKHFSNPAFESHFASPAPYVEAIRGAGGAAVLLPTGEADIARWLSVLDGVVLSGGADICPSHYGGDTSHAQLGPICPDRDHAEIALTHAVLEHGRLPVLFICRGMQILNVALGGTLHEHIEDLGQGDIHRCPQDFWARQAVTLKQQTKLSRAMGCTEVTTMSGHHQGIKTLGKGLRVLATAQDGIVEAVEVENHPFALAVQWHPEASAADDPAQQKLFNALVYAAEDMRSNHAHGA
jgi:putative glutamine amidotransferase